MPIALLWNMFYKHEYKQKNFAMWKPSMPMYLSADMRYGTYNINEQFKAFGEDMFL